ncbi:hypothetical protein M271_07155 [Streptomyces rapamycinicus NRRL 5491]|nr:hypothetical protein M271_07155 [Streptomyces rapamycinicus NRRL 5491]
MGLEASAATRCTASDGHEVHGVGGHERRPSDLA